jgi:hypothetical protein
MTRNIQSKNYSNLLKDINPDLLFFSHQRPPQLSPLAMAAKKLNIQAALMKSGANVGGGIAAAAINKIGFVKKQKMIIRGAAKLGIGALLPSFLKLKGKANSCKSSKQSWYCR